MKFKKLLQIGLPIVCTSLLTMPIVACAPTEETGVDIIHADGTTSHYDDINDAIANIRSGEALELNGNINLKDVIRFNQLNNITINGNGFTLNSSDNNASQGILNFTNCTNINLKDLQITGQDSYGVYLKNSNATFNNVGVIGSYKNVLYLEGYSGIQLSRSMLVSDAANTATNQTIYASENTTHINIDNTYLDSICYLKQEAASSAPTILINENVHLRYIRIAKELITTDFNYLVGGWRNAEGFLFGGYLDEENHWYRNVTDSDLYNGFYVLDAQGLYNFNQWYLENGDKEVIPAQLHLMNNIDWSELSDDKTWTPLDTGHKWDGDTTQQSQLTYPYAIKLFDGHGYTIRNLKILAVKQSVGIFGIVGDNVTQNINFYNCTVSSDAYQDVGLIYGCVVGHATLSNIFVSGNGTKEDHKNSSYIGGKKKVGSLVGIVSNNHSQKTYDPSEQPPEDRDMAKLTISGCNVENTWVVNKDEAKYGGDSPEIYLGGLVSWIAYHCNNNEGKIWYGGTISIDSDPSRTTFVTDIHFDWQQNYEEEINNFEIAILFLYGRNVGAERSQYHHCNAYQNIIVTYHGE